MIKWEFGNSEEVPKTREYENVYKTNLGGLRDDRVGFLFFLHHVEFQAFLHFSDTIHIYMYDLENVMQGDYKYFHNTYFELIIRESV